VLENQSITYNNLDIAPAMQG